MNTPFFLKSTSELDGSFFENTLLVIAEMNDQGATGFVLNKPFPRQLNDLAEFRHSRPFPLYDGGPVERERLFVLHRRPDLVANGKTAGEGLYLGGDMPDIIKAIDSNELTTTDIRLFIGYCGWNNDELEQEISEGSWQIVTSEKLW